MSVKVGDGAVVLKLQERRSLEEVCTLGQNEY